MNIHFYKYQGTGNDFIIINDWDLSFPSKNKSLIHLLCDRKFGIGADGLILLQKHHQYDFNMQYFNADGKESSMCGNGGRCIVAFAAKMNVIQEKTIFMAIDGLHQAIIKNNWVDLKMSDVNGIEFYNNDIVLNTGSPHYIQFVSSLKDIDIYNEGKKIRYNNTFKKEGINVNFVEKNNEHFIQVATYERGVENETLSCGTGVTAAAIAYGLNQKGNTEIKIQTKGGLLHVRFNHQGNYVFDNIWLSGPADFVYEGNINFPS